MRRRKKTQKEGTWNHPVESFSLAELLLLFLRSFLSGELGEISRMGASSLSVRGIQKVALEAVESTPHSRVISLDIARNLFVRSQLELLANSSTQSVLIGTSFTTGWMTR